MRRKKDFESFFSQEKRIRKNFPKRSFEEFWWIPESQQIILYCLWGFLLQILKNFFMWKLWKKIEVAYSKWTILSSLWQTKNSFDFRKFERNYFSKERSNNEINSETFFHEQKVWEVFIHISIIRLLFLFYYSTTLSYLWLTKNSSYSRKFENRILFLLLMQLKIAKNSIYQEDMQIIIDGQSMMEITIYAFLIDSWICLIDSSRSAILLLGSPAASHKALAFSA